MKLFLIIIGAVIVIGVGFWLVKPFFTSVEVNESLDDLTSMHKDKMASKKLPINESASETPPEKPLEEPAKDETTKEDEKPDPEPTTEPAAEPDPEPTTEPATPETVSQGSFEGRAAHNASGTAKLIKIDDQYYVRFEDDFSVTNGPDLFVGFGKDNKYTKSAQIAELKGNKGGQNYLVPDHIDATQFNEVWVWCRAFSVPFGRAPLQ